MSIHATAVVDPRAELAEGVEVGPYCIVSGMARIGARTVLQSHVVIDGQVTVGAGNLIGPGAIIGAPPQDLDFKVGTKSGVEIGDNNTLREYCTVHRGTGEETMTTIGNGNFLMVGTHLGHNCRIGNGVTIANDSLLGGYVEIGDQAFIGGASIFHQHVRVGRLVMTQGHSGVGKDIPPFCLAAEINQVFGLNVVGLRRAGFTAADRAEIKRAFTLLYRNGLNMRDAVAAAAAANFGPLGRELFDFVRAAQKRGIVGFRRRPNESTTQT